MPFLWAGLKYLRLWGLFLCVRCHPLDVLFISLIALFRAVCRVVGWMLDGVIELLVNLCIIEIYVL